METLEQPKPDDGFFYAAAVAKPALWPPHEKTTIFAIKGLVNVSALPSREIEAVLDLNIGQLSDITVPLLFRGVGAFILCVGFNNGELELRINSSRLNDKALGTRIIRCGRRNDSIDTDGIVKAEEGRRQHSKALLKRFDREALIYNRATVLKDELAALTDLVKLVEKGALHHLPGVAVSLRKLVVPGEGNQILRDLAALLALPLPVYTGPGPTQFDIPPSQQILKSISYLPSPGCIRKTDLEVWLAELGYATPSVRYDNATILRLISNKAGAHSEYDQGEVIGFLRKLHLGHEQIIVRYLIDVAKVALRLGESLVQRVSTNQCRNLIVNDF